MPPFVHQWFKDVGGGLACDGVSIESIVARVGTPVYIYSARAIRDAYRAIDDAFGSYPHAIHYALKANSTLGIVRLLKSIGSRVDANSGGEIHVALRAGYEPREIVFTGVGKTSEELEQAIVSGIGVINAESPGELDRIGAMAAALQRRARVALRVNPDIDAGSHPHISTGLQVNKFGMPLQDARGIYRERRDRPGLQLVGVHAHIGSQITRVEPVIRAARAVTTLALELRDDGIALEHIDVGGGLGIAYHDHPIVTPAEYAEAVVTEVQRAGVSLIVEPGRAVVGASAALVGRVVDTKEFPGGRRFAVLDAGMSELLRPALYGSYHTIVPVTPRPGPSVEWDVVGPICESSDVFGRERLLPSPSVGDLMAILDAGAYGSVMASNYNRHLLPPEVLVDGGGWTLIRRRQTMDDVLALEP